MERIESRDLAAAPARRGAPFRPPSDVLSSRELEVFRLLGLGRGTSQIADALGVRPKTVQTFRTRIQQKLDLKGYMELIREAVLWVALGADVRR